MMNVRLMAVLSLILLGITPTFGLAADYYVSPAGNDTSGTGTAEKPWRTISNAVANAGPGDTIRVGEDGDTNSVDYEETVTIGTDKPGLTVVAEGAVHPRIKAPAEQSIFTIEAGSVTLQGLEMDGVNPSMGVVFTAGSTETNVLNCRFISTPGDALWRAIYMEEGSSGHFISGCHFENQSYGFYSQAALEQEGNVIFQECSFIDCVASIEVQSITDLTVINCDFNGMSGGVKVSSGPRTEVSGSTFTNGAGIYLAGSQSCRIADNLFSSQSTCANLDGASYSLLTGNSFDGCGTGLSINSTQDSVIMDNTISDGGHGLVLNQSGGIIWNNTITGNSGRGLETQGKAAAMVGNIITGNATGIEASGDGPQFYLNTIGNSSSADFSGTNPEYSWSTDVAVAYGFDGASFKGRLGNYHPAYTGLDDGTDGRVAGDGIGDTQLPYPTTGSGDNWPLSAAPDGFSPEIWYLQGSDLLTTGQIAEPPGLPVGAAAGETIVFTAAQPALGHVTYLPGNAAGQTSWTYRLMAYQQSPGTILELGWSDGQGLEFFGPGTPSGPLPDSCDKYICTGALPDVPFTIPAGMSLTVRLNNQSSGSLTLYRSANFVSPSGPLYPKYPAAGSLEMPYSVTPGDSDLGEVEFGNTYDYSFTIELLEPMVTTIEGITVVGPHAADFSVLNSSTCGLKEAPVVLGQTGDICTVDLQFAPLTGGPRVAGFHVLADTGIRYIHLQAVAGPQFTLTTKPSPEGAGTITGSGLDCPGNCELIADQGTTHVLTAAAAEHATFESWSGCSSQNGPDCTVVLNGNTEVTASFIVKTPVLDVAPQELTFPETFVGADFGPETFTLSNLGKWALQFNSILLTGIDKADFAITSSTCEDILEPGGNCLIDIVFSPGTEGDKTAFFTIESDDPSSPVTDLPLSGKATIEPRTLSVQLQPGSAGTVTGEGIDCPDDCDETYPGPVTVTLTATPVDGFKYVQWVGCDQVAGADCTVEVLADMLVSAIFLKQAPRMVVNVSVLEYPEQEVGQPSAPQSITVSNTGDWPLTLGELAITGILGTDFALSQDTCSGQMVAPGENCTAAVVFTPSDGMIRAATLAVSGDDMMVPVFTVGLIGHGLVEETTSPPPVLSGPPKLLLIPGSINYGQTGLYSGPDHYKAIIYNIGGGEIRVDTVVIEGQDTTHFDIEDSSCENAILGPGDGCGANFFFLPKSDGEKRAHGIFKLKSGDIESPAVYLFGVGGAWTAPKNTSAKPVTGCSTHTDSASPTTIVLLMLLVGALLAIRQPHRIRFAILGLCMFIGTGVPTVSVTGCDPNGALGECMGNFRLTGTGAFANINDTFRFMLTATNITTDCNNTQFSIIEDVPSGGYLNNEAFMINLHLYSPLFPGHRYGAGTRMMVTIRGNLIPIFCYITDGYIEVTKVHYMEMPEACQAEISLKFAIDDALCDQGNLGIFEDDPETSTSSFHGTATYSYGSVPKECNPPSINPAEGLEDHYFPYAEYLPSEDENPLPIEYQGTESNLLHGTLFDVMSSDEEGSLLQEQWLDLNVEPPAAAWGNWLCECPHVNPGQFFRRCPLDAPVPFAVSSEHHAAADGDLSLRFCDHFGIQPQLLVNWDTGPQAPIIVTPETGQEHYTGDPLLLEWTPQPSFGDGSVTIRGGTKAVNESLTNPLFEFVVEDTGLFWLDAAFLQGLVDKNQTDFAIEVERAHLIEPEFTLPLATGSSILVRKIGRVAVSFKPGSSLTFPNPDEVQAGWTEPTQIGDLLMDPSRKPSPVADSTSDGLLYVAWISGSSHTRYGIFETATLTWLEADQDVSLTAGFGPLGLKAQPGQALLRGLHQPPEGGFLPGLARITPEGITLNTVLEGADKHDKTWPFGATLLSDGTSFAAWTNLDDKLYISHNEGPLTLAKDGIDAAYGRSPLFERGDGDAVVLPSNYNYFWRLDAGTGEVLEAVSANGKIDFDHNCLLTGAADIQGLFHLVCHNSPVTSNGLPTYGSFWLDSGEVVTETTTITDSPLLGDRYLSHQVTAGPDGRVWLLWMLSCEYGQCPVIYRRSFDGAWDGPFFGGPATGEVAMAVDPAGRVHLIYSDIVPGDTMEQSNPLFHTMTEVAP
jgi:parallel beta-helix repeat protein